MKGKRSKQYRKLMHQYALSFNFREPYQVLLDAEMIQDTTRFKMDLPHLLSRTLHGEVKPMITECCIRQLYTATTENREEKSAWIDTAKKCEKRRCGHQDLETPMAAGECIMSVVDPKASGTNKHRYIVASQDSGARRRLRQVAGVPLVYVQRSVMVMEPMAAKSEEIRDEQEEEKVRSGVRRRKAVSVGEKRKRDGSEDESGEGEAEPLQESAPKKKKRGPKGVNPLSAMKAKKPKVHNDAGPRAPMPDRIEKQIRAAREEAKKEKARSSDGPTSTTKPPKSKRKQSNGTVSTEATREDSLG